MRRPGWPPGRGIESGTCKVRKSHPAAGVQVGSDGFGLRMPPVVRRAALALVLGCFLRISMMSSGNRILIEDVLRDTGRCAR